MNHFKLKTPLAIACCVFCYFLNHAFADEDEGGSAKIGPDQAITKFDFQQGIQLSDLAQKFLEIKYQSVSNGRVQVVPKGALVHFQDDIGVYRFRNKWFKLVHINVMSSDLSKVTIQTDELMPTDQIVSQGVPLLRVADIEASGGKDEGHGD